MTDLTDIDKERIWEEVRKEFPNDQMMQEIHYVCLLHYHQTKRLSAQERIQFFRRLCEKADQDRKFS